MMWTAEELAALVPDRPRFVEVRGLLLSGRARVDLHGAKAPLSFIVADPEVGLACVVGSVSAEMIRAAANDVGELLAFDDNVAAVREALPQWSSVRARIFERAAGGHRTPVDCGPEMFRQAETSGNVETGRHVDVGRHVETGRYVEVGRQAETDRQVGTDRRETNGKRSGAHGLARVLSPEQVRVLLDEHSFAPYAIPAELNDELRRASSWGAPCGVAFDGAGTPAAFCYAAWLTERLWDVSIETLPTHRRQGHAAVAVEAMADYWAARGRRPVWGALESNTASLALAVKLGFTETDVLYVLSR